MEPYSLTLDEAFAFIKISKTYHRRINAVFYCLICRLDSLFGDSTHATRTTA